MLGCSATSSYIITSDGKFYGHGQPLSDRNDIGGYLFGHDVNLIDGLKFIQDRRSDHTKPGPGGTTMCYDVATSCILKITGSRPHYDEQSGMRTINIYTGDIYNTVLKPLKGTYIEQVTSTQSNTYPKSGKFGSYWYEYMGSEVISTEAEDFDYSNLKIDKEIVKWGGTINLLDNIKGLPNNSTQKDVTSPVINTRQSGDYTGKVQITFSDGSIHVVDVPVEVQKSEAENFTPEVKEIDVKEGEDPNYDDAITNLPEDATVEEKEKPDTSKPGETTGKVEITFPDGSTKEVEIPVKVVKDAGIITPVPEINKADIEKEVVAWGKTIDLTDNIKNLPEGATVADITDPAINTKESGDYTGRVEVTFKDGSKRRVDVPVEVQKSEAENFTPEVKEIDVKEGEDPNYDDAITNLPEDATVEEKEKPDTSKPGETTGKVEITFPDGSTKEVEIPVKVEDNSNICEDTTPLKEKIKELEDKIKKLEEKNKDLEDKIKDAEDKNKTTEDKISDLEDQKKDLEDKLEEEKAKEEQDQDKIKELEDKIKDLEKQIEDLGKEKEKTDEEIGDLKKKVADQDKTAKEKDEEIKELKKQLEEAKKASEEKDKKENKDNKDNTSSGKTNNNNVNVNIDNRENDNIFEREYRRRNDDRRYNRESERLPFEIVYEREVPRYTVPVQQNYEQRLEYIFTIGSTVYQRIMGANVENISMDVAPYIKNNRTMLPLRYVAEAIGAEVRWDNATRTAYFTKDGITAKIQIDGNKIEMSDGRIITMDSKPDNIKGRIFVSLTNVSKVFNLTNGNIADGINQQIEWNNNNRTVSISLNR